jgi:hypothetical protein
MLPGRFIHIGVRRLGLTGRAAGELPETQPWFGFYFLLIADFSPPDQMVPVINKATPSFIIPCFSLGSGQLWFLGLPAGQKNCWPRDKTRF